MQDPWRGFTSQGQHQVWRGCQGCQHPGEAENPAAAQPRRLEASEQEGPRAQRLAKFEGLETPGREAGVSLCGKGRKQRLIYKGNSRKRGPALPRWHGASNSPHFLPFPFVSYPSYKPIGSCHPPLGRPSPLSLLAHMSVIHRHRQNPAWLADQAILILFSLP